METIYWVIIAVMLYIYLTRTISKMPAPDAVGVFKANSKKKDKPI